MSYIGEAATGTVLQGNGTDLPKYTATPTVTSITLGSGNALNTFVIGTWTPAFAFGGGTTGIVYGSQVGYYTQIGDVVFITCAIHITSKGSSTGAWTLTGLPVSTGGNGAQHVISGTCFNAVTMTTNYTVPFFSCRANSTTIDINQSGSAQSSTNLSNTNAGNLVTFQFTGFYKTN